MVRILAIGNLQSPHSAITVDTVWYLDCVHEDGLVESISDQDFVRRFRDWRSIVRSSRLVLLPSYFELLYRLRCYDQRILPDVVPVGV